MLCCFRGVVSSKLLLLLLELMLACQHRVARRIRVNATFMQHRVQEGTFGPGNGGDGAGLAERKRAAEKAKPQIGHHHHGQQEVATLVQGASMPDSSNALPAAVEEHRGSKAASQRSSPQRTSRGTPTKHHALDKKFDMFQTELGGSKMAAATEGSASARLPAGAATPPSGSPEAEHHSGGDRPTRQLQLSRKELQALKLNQLAVKRYVVCDMVESGTRPRTTFFWGLIAPSHAMQA
jgi:hypothetical protein